MGAISPDIELAIFRVFGEMLTEKPRSARGLS